MNPHPTVPVYANLSIPNSEPGSANLTLPRGAKGPIAIIMPGSDNLSIRPVSVAGNAISPTPNDIDLGTNQVVLFEQGIKLAAECTFKVWNDGAGAVDSQVSYHR